ncbi:hypothetical protein HPC49_23830 [Pyxidicoccus fallax]|uniref:Lipoprotein n=1 Tax=Pyxidicoccus fallax TaxID=394095 RepID=A0A848LJ67_9BACT|nr:hypothetical protein [Pyxidicoccus fallax]NMO17728.1 hypothetical protein [Pyxidicoccus fallax]NPC81246.1 hypothetical protein [Pyxidicoccus fallax]
MKRSLAVLAAVIGFSLLGCGGTGTEEVMEATPEAGEESTVSQFATCTATCGNGSTSVSCSGSTCSASDFQGVTCNGVFKPCPPPPCSGYPTCTSLLNTYCSVEGAEQACCSGTSTTFLTCGRNSTSPRLQWLY